MIANSNPNALIYIPYARVNFLKTIPFTAAHTYIAHIWQYPPPPPGTQATIHSCFQIHLINLSQKSAICKSIHHPCEGERHQGQGNKTNEQNAFTRSLQVCECHLVQPHSGEVVYLWIKGNVEENEKKSLLKFTLKHSLP